MKNSNPDFVPYKESVILHNLGFKPLTFGYYTVGKRGRFKGKVSFREDTKMQVEIQVLSGEHIGIVRAPLFQQARKWINKKHNKDYEVFWHDGKWHFRIEQLIKTTSGKYFKGFIYGSKKPFLSHERAEKAALSKTLQLLDY